MDGRKLKFLNIVDEYSRICLAIRVSRRCKAVDVIAAIEKLLGEYPATTHLRMGNGPEFISHALQEWCTEMDPARNHSPGSPWEEIRGDLRAPLDFVYNGRFRDKFLNIEPFASVAEAKVLAKQHRIEYNVFRPYSALQGRKPLEVFQKWKAT